MRKVIAEEAKLDNLVTDIEDFIGAFNRLPTIEEVATWAEDLYGYRFQDTKEIKRIIREGAKKAGWHRQKN